MARQLQKKGYRREDYAARGKRKFEMGRESAETRISDVKRKKVHTMVVTGK